MINTTSTDTKKASIVARPFPCVSKRGVVWGRDYILAVLICNCYLHACMYAVNYSKQLHPVCTVHRGLQSPPRHQHVSAFDYNQQTHWVLHMCSLLCHLLTNHHSTCNHTMFAIHHTQLYYMTVYHTRYMNYSVNVFLRSNWNHTVSIFLSSIRNVIMLLCIFGPHHPDHFL